jgi:hypothetical protein
VTMSWTPAIDRLAMTVAFAILAGVVMGAF